MATTVLRDAIKCECGKEMFPASFDKARRLVSFHCSDPTCGKKVEVSFKDIEVPKTTDFKYFCFNDDGEMTWKCHNHGYCDFDISWFMIDWQRKVNRFLEARCAVCNTEEEAEARRKYALQELKSEHNALDQFLNRLDKEKIETLVQEVLGELTVPQDYVDALRKDFIERMDAIVTQILNQTWNGRSAISYP